jgi:DUF1365 family protein
MMSALYSGIVVRQRFKPRRHRLRYRLSQMLFDLDAMPSLRLFSHNRFNLVRIYDRDHLDGSGTDLRLQIELALVGAGLRPDGGAIRLLCMPRILGHAFNPISVFFCHRRDGGLMALLYQVNNTFGQRHSYLIPVEDPDAATIRQHCDKAFYVSPFMRLDMSYAFHVVPPDETVAVVVHGDDAEGRVITASFAGRRQALSDGALIGMLLRHGLLSLKVLGAIHSEAVKLWLKGLRIQPRPVAARPCIHRRSHSAGLSHVRCIGRLFDNQRRCRTRYGLAGASGVPDVVLACPYRAADDRHAVRSSFVAWQ